MAPNIAVKNAPPIIDHIIGKGFPAISIDQSNGRSSSVAIHLPSMAPTKPTPADIKHPPLPTLKPPMLWPIPPQMDAMSKYIKKSKKDMVITLRVYGAQIYF